MNEKASPSAIRWTAGTAMTSGARLPPATSIAKACVECPPRVSYARSTTLTCAGDAAVGDHASAPVTGSSVIPAGASSRTYVTTAPSGSLAAIVALYGVPAVAAVIGAETNPGAVFGYGSA